MRVGWVARVDARDIGARTGLMVCLMIPCSETVPLTLSLKQTMQIVSFMPRRVLEESPVCSAGYISVSSCCSPPSMHAFPVICQHCGAYISLHCLPTLSACTLAWSALCTCGVPQDPPRCAILWIRQRAVYPCGHLSLQCMSNSIIVSIGFLSLMLLIARVLCEYRSL